jgi:hypothetical protein
VPEQELTQAGGERGFNAEAISVSAQRSETTGSVLLELISVRPLRPL